ncbi:MAG: hypothetical protein AVDCRST_MAG59-3454, partial [uncultured Thermomicrobiales bacterium]
AGGGAPPRRAGHGACRGRPSPRPRPVPAPGRRRRWGPRPPPPGRRRFGRRGGPPLRRRFGPRRDWAPSHPHSRRRPAQWELGGAGPPAAGGRLTSGCVTPRIRCRRRPDRGARRGGSSPASPKRPWAAALLDAGRLSRPPLGTRTATATTGRL